MSAAGRLGALGLLGVLTAGLTGCGSLSLQGVPLPGGASVGDHPYEVTVQFRDVQDLVPQAGVRVNNVTVGQVRDITLGQPSWTAAVHVVLNGDVALPANADAQLKQTTLLGEKYVELDAPTDAAPSGRLTDGAVIPVSRTNRFPEIEEIFGALSMLLNGGGIGQIQSISHELNTALSGHEGDTRALLSDLNTLVGTLDGQKTSITRALDGLDRLSASLAAPRGTRATGRPQLQPGLAVLDEQRPQLVGLLRALDRLSGVATSVIDRSQDDLVHDLDSLRPTLLELARTEGNIPKSLEVLVTVPFTDAAIKGIRGDYLNLNVQVDLNIQDLLDNLLNASTVRQSLPDPLAMLPVIPQKLPSLPGLSTPELPIPGTRHDDDSGPSISLPLPGLGGGR